MATNSYIQVPPDSTGKRLYTQQHTVDALPVQAQVVHIGCATHPNHIQQVDGRGQAFMRFAEGSPTMDAFGGLRVSNATILGAYEHTNGPMSDLFTEITASGGTITYQPTSAEVVLSVNSTNGSKAERATNRYHFYQPGTGNLIIITLSHGDTGKSNNIRYWGYGDDDNGLFFRLNGTTMQVLIRSSTSGSVVETAINQADWNGDKLDGTGISGMTLDLTKGNFYWIDYAWLGVGPVRFGVLAPDGSRWTCHTFQNPNSNVGPYMATGSLPLHFENKNIGVTSGTSELKLICASVYSESQTDYTYWRFADADSGAPRSITSTQMPVVSLRPKLTYNGKVNRVGLFPQCISVFVTGGTIKMTIVDDATLTGDVWVAGEETAEYDASATAMSGGSKFHSFYLEPGTHHIDIAHLYELNDEGYHVLFDGLSAYTMTLGAMKMNAGDTVTCSATINYRELR